MAPLLQAVASLPPMPHASPWPVKVHWALSKWSYARPGIELHGSSSMLSGLMWLLLMLTGYITLAHLQFHQFVDAF